MLPRHSLAALLIVVLASCQSGGLDSAASARVRQLRPLTDIGDPAACFEVGKLICKANYNNHGTAKAIPILQRGAGFGTSQATQPQALACAEQLAHAHISVAYANVFDGDFSEAESEYQKGKQLYVYLHQQRYGSYADPNELAYTLDSEDEGMRDAYSRQGHMASMSRQANLAMISQIPGNFASGLGAVPTPSVPAFTRSTSSFTQSAATGDSRLDNPISVENVMRQPPNANGCPGGQLCRWGCNAKYDGTSGARPAEVCTGRDCGQPGTCYTNR